MVRVVGQVRFADPPPSGLVTVRVAVEDVTELDAPAVVVGEQVVPGVLLPPRRTGRLRRHGRPRRAAQLSVRVHADLTGDGRASPRGTS